MRRVFLAAFALILTLALISSCTQEIKTTGQTETAPKTEPTGSVPETTQDPVETVDPEATLRIIAGEGVLPEGAVVTVVKLEVGSEACEAVKAALGDLAERFVAYGVTVEVNGEAVQPSQSVTVTAPVPAEFDGTVELYAIGADGKAVKLEATLGAGATELSAVADLAAYFAVVQAAGTGSSTDPDPSTTSNGPTTTTKRAKPSTTTKKTTPTATTNRNESGIIWRK